VNVLSLFSGIGGLELGLERAGMTTVGQVELDPFCRRVLAKHWPEVPRHDDVRTCVDWWWGRSRPPVHAVAGGPPCQPASRSGLRLGAADPRWGWPWFLDVVRALRPRFAIMENPTALLDLDGGDAFGWILGELASVGLDAEWSVLSACAVGAPHVRSRLFVVAHANGVDGAPWLGWDQHVGAEVRTDHWDSAGGASPLDRAVAAQRCPDGVAGGLAARMVAAGGNAVVPQVAEHIGRLIVAVDLAAGGAR
jgi:DNA (cytosine-5)-methyltransferase 1